MSLGSPAATWSSGSSCISSLPSVSEELSLVSCILVILLITTVPSVTMGSEGFPQSGQKQLLASSQGFWSDGQGQMGIFESLIILIGSSKPPPTNIL